MPSRCDDEVDGVAVHLCADMQVAPNRASFNVTYLETDKDSKKAMQLAVERGRLAYDTIKKAAGKGSIINLGSESGILPLSRVFTYSASKAAVHNLSKNLAREWAAKGVRVNTLVPGFFPAEQNRKVLTPERVAMILGKTPMNRFGEAKELIGASLLLASDAGSFVTGAEIVVDGGFAAMSI